MVSQRCATRLMKYPVEAPGTVEALTDPMKVFFSEFDGVHLHELNELPLGFDEGV